MANILFLTLSSQMWDGFQALWEDLSLNNDNIINVIQMPLYEKRFDGSLVELPYNTDGFPNEISPLSPKDYDWESNHPDVIYTQYAQDGSNLGFSVDPFFYVENLKKFATSIVYIPYAIMPEPNVSDEIVLQDLKPLLIYNSLSYVDKIIVQSENMKKAYIELLAGKDEQKRLSWENKISWEDYPRRLLLDKYLKAAPQMPASWKENLLKPNGEKKKLLFVSTSINGILTQNRSLIRKTRDFFDSIMSDKENTAVIWRPYPLLSDALSKMRPHLINDYQDLITYFRGSGLGVIDNSASPSIAISISDAYVGDPCGIMELYKSTGKPIHQLFTVL